MATVSKLRTSGLVVAIGVVVAGCGSAIECTSDADCGGGLHCAEEHGLFSEGVVASTCAPTCERDDECEEGHACVPGFAANNPEFYPQCLPACRQDSDCADGGRCGFWQCSGAACAQHTDCATGERCEGGYCEEGCRSDDQCASGHYCSPAAVGPYHCVETLSIACGELRCESIRGFDGRIDPCCVPGDVPACGYRPAQIFGGTNGGGLECIVPTPGEPDPTCPFSQFGQPCRDSDGMCGGLYATDVCGPRFAP